MANFSNMDFPPLSHNPTRSLSHPTRSVTRPTRSSTHPTRSLTQSEPSILGNPPSHVNRGGGSHRRGGRWAPPPNDHDHHHHGDDGDVLCEKFDELEVIEESIKLAKIIHNETNINININDNGEKNDVKMNHEGEIVGEEIPVKASGENVPKSVSKFEEIIGLGLELHENIKKCKYVKPTPIQCHAIPIIMAGRDLMACAQTGSGKTAAFCFPIIAGILKRGGDGGGGGGNGGGGFRGRGRVACPVALIMSPTRELSSQIHDEAKKFADQTGVRVVVAYGGTPISEQLRKLERGVDILVATPGRLVDMIERGRISLRMVKYFTLDEADSMLDMGFEPQIRKIAEEMDMPPTGARQTMLFSATFPTEIQRLASDFLSNYIFLTVGKVGSSNDMIEQKVELVNDYDKRKHLKELLFAQNMRNQGKPPLTIVFAETKRSVDNLAQWLSQKGFPATAIHGDKVQMERERALKSFKSGATPIIVATDVAARGLDIPCVAHVINYDLPRDIEHYVHRIGRTGRAGKSGLATAFFCDKDRPISKALVKLMEEANQSVPSWLTEYARSTSTHGYGGGNGGGRRPNRGSRFGGHDYRSFNQPDFSNSYTDNYSSPYSEKYTSAYTDEIPKVSYTEDYTKTCVDEVPKVETFEAYGSTHGYGSIVATGWD
ncbi:hypothetical protein RND81_07G107200 [Saponaria officinalis]|uniref:RNA helicase n=1 Tax=Saponaria officinalis TaxID=3572 RepID=A0AAW1JM29_SAPOF